LKSGIAGACNTSAPLNAGVAGGLAISVGPAVVRVEVARNVRHALLIFFVVLALNRAKFVSEVTAAPILCSVEKAGKREEAPYHTRGPRKFCEPWRRVLHEGERSLRAE
jgi:hypothetical protein